MNPLNDINSLMEAGGIEPPSRDVSERASTCVVDHLRFASGNSDRQDSPSASSTVFSPVLGRSSKTGQPTVFAQHH